MKGNTFTAVVRNGGLGRVDVQVDGLAPTVETNIPVAESVGLLADGDIVVMEYANDGRRPIITGRLSKDDVRSYNDTGLRDASSDTSASVEIRIDGSPTASRLANGGPNDQGSMPSTRASQRQTIDSSKVEGGLQILFGDDGASDRMSAAKEIKNMMTERPGVGMDYVVQKLSQAAQPRGAVRMTKYGQEMEY